MARKTYPDPPIERAVREVRRIRDELSLVYAELEELAEKAGTGEAEKVIDEWLEGRISDEEAERKLRALAEAR